MIRLDAAPAPDDRRPGALRKALTVASVGAVLGFGAMMTWDSMRSASGKGPGLFWDGTTVSDDEGVRVLSTDLSDWMSSDEYAHCNCHVTGAVLQFSGTSDDRRRWFVRTRQGAIGQQAVVVMRTTKSQLYAYAAGDLEDLGRMAAEQAGFAGRVRAAHVVEWYEPSPRMEQLPVRLVMIVDGKAS